MKLVRVVSLLFLLFVMSCTSTPEKSSQPAVPFQPVDAQAKCGNGICDRGEMCETKGGSFFSCSSQEGLSVGEVCNVCKQFVPSPVYDGIIAMGDADDQKKGQIYLISPDGSNRKQLTFNSNREWAPKISPDGKSIAYMSSSATGVAIKTMSIDGSNQKEIAKGSIPDWSSDSKRITFAGSQERCTNRETCPSHIYVMDADGSNIEQITFGDFKDGIPAWSPDDRYVAFASNRVGGGFAIWTVEVATGDLRQLTTTYYDDILEAQIEQKVPAWSPNGKYIAYWSGVEMTDPRTTPEVPRDVWIMNADGTGQRKLTPGDDPAWSPDSNTITFPVNRPSEASKLPIGVGAISPDGTQWQVLFYTQKTFGRASWGILT